MIPRQEEGVTHVIEFTFALTLFLIIIQAFSTTMDFRIGVDLDSNDNRIAAARSITHELAGSSGFGMHPAPAVSVVVTAMW